MIQDYYVKAYSSLIGDSLLFKPLRFLLRHIANLHLKLVFRFGKQHYSCSGQKGDVIVSLTSFPARIKNVWLGIETLLRQSVPPQIIYLWLSKEQFSDSSLIPYSLKELQKRGVEIRLVDGDIRSHKKYYYVFKEHPDDLVLLADDDIIYPSDLIQALLKARNQDKREKLIAHRYGYKMRYSNNGELEPYNKWGSYYSAYEGKDLFFGSGGGTLVRPKDLWKDVLNIDLALKLCPQADDIWLNAMAKLNNCYYVKIQDGPILPILNKKDAPLYETNLRQNLNDIQLQRLKEYCIKIYKTNPFDTKQGN